jgi:hypothetical protein
LQHNDIAINKGNQQQYWVNDCPQLFSHDDKGKELRVVVVAHDCHLLFYPTYSESLEIARGWKLLGPKAKIRLKNQLFDRLPLFLKSFPHMIYLCVWKIQVATNANCK